MIICSFSHLSWNRQQHLVDFLLTHSSSACIPELISKPTEIYQWQLIQNLIINRTYLKTMSWRLGAHLCLNQPCTIGDKWWLHFINRPPPIAWSPCWSYRWILALFPSHHTQQCKDYTYKKGVVSAANERIYPKFFVSLADADRQILRGQLQCFQIWCQQQQKYR